MSLADRAEPGSIWIDDKDEIYMRVYDPFGKYPWMFLNCLASLEPAEPRDADFPHPPLTRMVPDARKGVISE